MSEPVLLVNKKDGIATLTLNRPDQLNALSTELRTTLARELERLRTDPEIGVVILTGAGRAFCAGLDLKEMRSRVPLQDEDELPDLPLLLRSLPQPVIGAINGVAVTGAMEIALSCDLLIATPEARFADTHARLGLIAGWGLSQRLSRAIGVNRAKELSLTGNYLSAEQACEWGLVNRVVSREELLPTCTALAKDMLSCVPEAMRLTKRMIDRGYDMALGDAMTYEREINRIFVLPTPIAEERSEAVQERGGKQTRQ